MQIHELNNKKRPNKEQVDEVFQDAFNLGKQIITNPKSVLSTTGIAQAKQAATAQSAAQTAGKLSKQGYTTAAAPKTTAEVLQQVKANPATQQMIKNLVAQWQQVATQLTGNKTATTEAVATATAAPTAVKPQTQKIVAPASNAQYAQRPGGYAQVKTNAPLAYAAPQKAQQPVQTQATIATKFTEWATERLTALNADDWDSDPSTVSSLKALANKIAANPTNSDNDIIEYFNQAIAANIASKNARRAGFYQPGQTQQTAQGQTQQKPQDITAQAGLTPQTLQGLGAVLRKADQGSMTMPRTNNPVADAMFQQMGFKLK